MHPETQRCSAAAQGCGILCPYVSFLCSLVCRREIRKGWGLPSGLLSAAHQ